MSRRWPNGSIAIPRVTSEFGMRVNPVTHVYTLHAGIDLVGFVSNLACQAGVVTFARYNGGAGNEVRVRHDDGTETRYKHNARFLVSVGQRVYQGTPLGIQGRTGDATGVHLHFECRVGPLAAPQNPRAFMSARVSGSAGGDAVLIDEKESMMSAPGRKIEIVKSDQAQHNVAEWAPGFYVMNAEGIDFPKNALAWALFDKLTAADSATIVQCFGSEAREADAFLRANVAKNRGLSQAQLEAALQEAFDDVEIPTPSISTADIAAIAAGTVAKLGTNITNG